MHWLLKDVLGLLFGAAFGLSLIFTAYFIGCWLADKTRR